MAMRYPPETEEPSFTHLPWRLVMTSRLPSLVNHAGTVDRSTALPASILTSIIAQNHSIQRKFCVKRLDGRG